MSVPDRLFGRCFRGKTVTFKFNAAQYIVLTEDIAAIEQLWAKLGFIQKLDISAIKEASLIPHEREIQ